MGPAEQEEGGSLQIPCQPNILKGWWVSRGCIAINTAQQPHRRRLSYEHAGKPRLCGRDDVPAEVSEFLVDALESHDCVYVGWCVCVECCL
jgi:hypothetical protein